jgi:hypothetical protein
VRSLATVGLRIERLAAQRRPQRRVLCVVGDQSRIDWQRVERLESEGAEVVLVTTGVPRSPDQAEGGMVEHELGPQPWLAERWHGGLPPTLAHLALLAHPGF